MGMTLAGRNLTLAHQLTTFAVAARPTSWEVLLHSGDPGDTGANEIAVGSYARQSVTFTRDTGAGSVSNSADIVFPTASAGYSYSFVSILDNLGNSLVVLPLAAARTLLTGGAARIAAGELVIGGAA